MDNLPSSTKTERAPFGTRCPFRDRKNNDVPKMMHGASRRVSAMIALVNLTLNSQLELTLHDGSVQNFLTHGPLRLRTQVKRNTGMLLLKPSVTFVPAIDTREIKSQKSWSSTEVRILESARHLIADEGYHNFSMRGIAQKSGIHLKSLQYYFRTKQELLASVVNYTIEKYYFETYDKMFVEKGAITPFERFSLMLDHLLADLSDPFTARLFPELWALASHDTDVAAALDLFYVRHIASIEQMITVLNPRLPDKVAFHRAALVAMMIEGLVLIMGHGKKRRPEHVGLLVAAKETVLRLVTLPMQPGADDSSNFKSTLKSNKTRRSRKL